MRMLSEIKGNTLGSYLNDSKRLFVISFVYITLLLHTSLTVPVTVRQNTSVRAVMGKISYDGMLQVSVTSLKLCLGFFFFFPCKTPHPKVCYSSYNTQ